MKYNRPWQNYEEYVASQTETNIKKINHIWITDDEIKKISQWVKEKNITVKYGICHGVRNGYEVKQFRKSISDEIIGTEISHTANQFENVIQWDFHHLKEDWIDKFDFIYSNSIDHSYDFNFCLDQWMKSLTKNGVCFIEWSTGHSDWYYPLNDSDCFSIGPFELADLIVKKYKIAAVFSVGPERIAFAVQHLNSNLKGYSEVALAEAYNAMRMEEGRSLVADIAEAAGAESIKPSPPKLWKK